MDTPDIISEEDPDTGTQIEIVDRFIAQWFPDTDEQRRADCSGQIIDSLAGRRELIKEDPWLVVQDNARRLKAFHDSPFGHWIASDD